MSSREKADLAILKTLFWLLVAIFVVVVSVILIPAPVFIKRRLFPSMAVLSIAFFLLGLALVLLTLKKKVKGKLKRFLILTGASSSGFFISVFLHNFLYGLAVITHQITGLHYLMEALHVLFFIVAVFICPIGFLVGAVGSAVLLLCY